jgi:hypothetical protein
MKPKFLYAAMILISLGLFTSAKEANWLCIADIICKKSPKEQPVKQKDMVDKSFDLSPLRQFIFISAISN